MAKDAKANKETAWSVLPHRPIEKLADMRDLQRVIVSHEKIASGKDAAEALKKAATFL